MSCSNYQARYPSLHLPEHTLQPMPASDKHLIVSHQVQRSCLQVCAPLIVPVHSIALRGCAVLGPGIQEEAVVPAPTQPARTSDSYLRGAVHAALRHDAG